MILLAISCFPMLDCGYEVCTQQACINLVIYPIHCVADQVHNECYAAAAIAIHNFPEGIATFIVGLATPQLGIALAVAIAVHSIPEGNIVTLSAV